MWTSERIHKELRAISITLSHFKLIQISVIFYFSYLAGDLLIWYKGIMTPERFSEIAFWGAWSGIVAAIFAALKFLNSNIQKEDKE